MSPYADSELDELDTRILAAHLRDCEECSHYLAMVMAIKGPLSSSPPQKPPTG
jgi:anti-sigma factor RsiW